MTKEITISPTTRIEGHGKVTITLDDSGNVADAIFYCTEIRGFEYFLKGMEADRLPFIISRICGVCSTAHIMASVEAIESIYKTEITVTAKQLRELLLMGQIINNHSLVCYFLTLPDFWFPLEEDSSKRNIFQIMRERPDIGKKAIALRSFGARILDVIGKREVHILSVIPGGVVYPLKPQEREELLKEAENAYTITLEALNMGKELFEKNWTDFKKAGDYKTHYMALTKNNTIDFYSGKIRIINTEGKTIADVAPSDYMNHIEEKTSSWTYAKFAYLKILGWPQGIVQVGPTARINVNNRATTKVANAEMQEFKNKYGNPAHATILLDYARLIDLMYAVERAKELLENVELTRDDTRVKVERRNGKGVGVVEAPRGTLAHEYVLDNFGRLEQLKLMIPTQINNLAINLNVKDAATQFIRNGEIKPGLLNRIEMITRAYDPCIKCATRQTGEKLKVEIRDPRGRVVMAL